MISQIMTKMLKIVIILLKNLKMMKNKLLSNVERCGRYLIKMIKNKLLSKDQMLKDILLYTTLEKSLT